MNVVNQLFKTFHGHSYIFFIFHSIISTSSSEGLYQFNRYKFEVSVYSVRRGPQKDFLWYTYCLSLGALMFQNTHFS